MRKRIKRKDYILITDDTQDRYLQIGEVIEVQNYPHSDDVQLYRVKFIDEVVEYKYTLEDECKVLMLER